MSASPSSSEASQHPDCDDIGVGEEKSALDQPLWHPSTAIRSLFNREDERDPTLLHDEDCEDDCDTHTVALERPQRSEEDAVGMMEPPDQAGPMIYEPSDAELALTRSRVLEREAELRRQQGRKRRRMENTRAELVRCQKREIQQLESEYKRLQYEQEAVEQNDDVDVQEANNELDERMQETFRGLVQDVTRAWREEHSLVSALSSYLESDRK
ncbi:hypothetical protein Poli38472_011115 [Pythium oligandrum]|uniref:Uncharacterized protein n=1 Tax=Pythium oligandrum TaxID=41045 RepID=A0A8K1CQ65_PYTOL|nr:hypothetical protein Poli38472_011115 [Pythium oligandrum]|eukprot:TMW67495.1 hypothetical protein Poli38472_011115 [Pythium oligandrum]